MTKQLLTCILFIFCLNAFVEALKWILQLISKLRTKLNIYNYI